MRASVSGCMRTAPSAVAWRTVSAFAETSTMRAAPCSSTWESPPGPADSAIVLVPHECFVAPDQRVCGPAHQQSAGNAEPGRNPGVGDDDADPGRGQEAEERRAPPFDLE